MTAVVWKYPVPLQDEFDLEIPGYCNAIAFQVQDGRPYVWVECKPEEPLSPYRFFLIGTGFRVPNARAYVGTIQLDGFVWHLYSYY
jgi:hypothetical protein